VIYIADGVGETWRHWQEMVTRNVSSLTARYLFSRALADDEGAISINYGSRAQKQVKEAFNSFVINPPPAEETPAPTPSGSFNRRRSVESQHKFDCPAGHTYCWTGERQEYACMDTSSDVTGMSPPSLPFPSSLRSLITLSALPEMRRT
jgi:hypothetical protein